VIRAQHLRRVVSPSPCDLCVLSVSALDCSSSPVFPNFLLSTFDFQPSPSSNSFPAISFADPHPVNPVVSTFYKNLEGRGAFLVFEPANIQPSNPKFGSWKGLRDLPTCLAKSHGIKSLTDPHPLTLLESYRFENVTGRGRLQPSDTKPLLSRHRFASISHLDATLTDLPASVANKRLTVLLSPLDATLTINTGVGIPSARLPRRSTFRRLDVPTIPYPPKSLPLNLFADPHPLNLYATILYKNSGGAPVGVCGYSSHFGLP